MTRSTPTADAAAATPARQLDLPRSAGCRMLPGRHGGWLDGGEQRIAAIVGGAADRSSTSDELAAHRGDWIQRYHLSRERANVVRCLDIPSDCTVLEVGAGCGAVTRYLGEVAGAVDALEPTPERAAIVRSRTHDLPNVEVFVGQLAALPAEPAYDLVVIVGVLEYVGGSAGLEPRVAFLREAAARLKPDGAVVCAIENQLGVKYLAGAPEDHAGAPFEGIEDYPRRGSFRTFPRRALERMFGEAGLSPEVYHAFPDYKLPRLIYSDALLDGDAAPLAWRAARFPSPDEPVARPRLAHEGRLWRSVVRAGLGGELANSFVVVGRKDEWSPWPDDQHAVFWSAGRRTRFSTVSRLVAGTSTPARVERAYLRDFDGPRSDAGLVHHCSGSDYLTAEPLSEVLEEVADGELEAWLRRWRRHAEHAAASDGTRTNIDVGPQNVIVDGDALRTIDEEWSHAAYSTADAIDRTLLHLSFALADGRSPESWPQGCESVRDVVDVIYERAGLDAPTEAELLRVVRREAELQAQISDADPREPTWAAAVDRRVADVRLFLGRPLTETALGRREPDELAALIEHAHALDAARCVSEAAQRSSEAALARAEDELRQGNRELYALKARYDELQAKHESLIRSRSWRMVVAWRRIAARARRPWR